MKIAYLILVHQNPKLLARAIRALSTESCAFFIHVDKKSSSEAFSNISGQRITFVDRIPVYWGEFSSVEATLRIIQHALSSRVGFDYLVLMQGSDYPLRSGEYIPRFLEQNQGSEFISMVRMPAPGFPLSKINTFRYTSDKPVRRLMLRAAARLGLAKRDHKKYLGNLEPYAGDACWTLTRKACEYILEFVHQNPAMSSYFRYTFAPDESFFHTILGNSPFRARARRSLLYRYWPTPGPHPQTLTSERVKFFEDQERVWIEDEFGTGEALFARKFSDDNLDLLDRIDAMIERKGVRDFSPLQFHSAL
jgi:hypothetical protein